MRMTFFHLLSAIIVSHAVGMPLLVDRPVPASKPAKQKVGKSRLAFNTTYVPDESVAAFALRPNQIVNNSLLQKVFTRTKKITGRSPLHDFETELAEKMGCTFQEWNELVLVLNQDVIETYTRMTLGAEFFTGKRKPTGEFPIGEEEEQIFDLSKKVPGIILRYSKPLNKKLILRKSISFELGQADPDQKTEKIKGYTLYTHSSISACLPNTKTLLLGPTPTVIAMLKKSSKKTPLKSLLQKTDRKDDVIFAVTGSPVKDLVGKLPRNKIPPPFVKLANQLAQTKSILATARLSGKTLAKIRFDMPDLARATDFSTTLNTLPIAFLKMGYQKSFRPEMLKEFGAYFMPVVKLMDRTVASLQAKPDDAATIVSVTRPPELDSITAKLDGVIRGLHAKAIREARREKLRQIGLAFHNYHEVFDRFPSHAGNSEGKQRGLSWRVHILPFIDESNLYKLFKLNEPWDSPHNKKLIAKMPDIFKHPDIKAVGKTSIHVFTGPGTPFNGKKGAKIEDIKDGTSSTILAVEAGPDKAAIWTKPGGIPFDEELESLEFLGRTGKSFLVLFFDGRVKKLKRKMNVEVFLRMIQHQDGEKISDQDWKAAQAPR
ncbi:MAG: hypothetical protein Tsb009_28530 [Planctomycetaceae bacterium]